MADSPLAPVKIVAPRGTGRAALVKKARLMAEERGIYVVRTGPIDSLTADGCLYADLADGLRRRPSRTAKKSVASPPLERVLKALVRQRPLALLVDDAMGCDPRPLGELLCMCQEIITYQYPLMLLLAGTPRIDQTLGRADASFIFRARNLQVNALAPAATREALRKPFIDNGAKFKPKALELMAGMAGGYPLFIQIVGYWAWEEMMAAKSDEVDEQMVRRAKAQIQRERDEFYQLVYGEMKRNVGLLDHARFVMKLLKLNRGRVADDMITETLAERFDKDAEERALEAFHKLVDYGFIWSRGGEIEAGIPSFFNYCDAKDKKTARLRRPGKKK